MFHRLRARAHAAPSRTKRAAGTRLTFKISPREALIEGRRSRSQGPISPPHVASGSSALRVLSDALAEMEKQAAKLGADAVVGVDVDYESVGSNMLMVSASGTAVKPS